MLTPGRDAENKKKDVPPSSPSASEHEGEERKRKNRKRHAARPLKYLNSDAVPKRRQGGGAKKSKRDSESDEEAEAEETTAEVTEIGKLTMQLYAFCSTHNCASMQRHYNILSVRSFS